MNELEFSKTLKDLNLQLFKVIQKRHKDLGIDITPIQGTIILTIAENKKILCQKDLEQYVSCNKSTLSSILDTMEKKELIKRTTDSTDTRKKSIVLTKKSENVITKIYKDRYEVEKNMCEGITKDEMKIFYNTINKMLKNLERM